MFQSLCAFVSVCLSFCLSVFVSVFVSVFSVCLFVCLSVTPFALCSHHRIIMKFSGVYTIDRSDAHTKGQCQRLKFMISTEVKITDFEQNWELPDHHSSLNSQMATKWCTKLEVAKKRCPIVFQGHPSNLKVTQDKNCQFWPAFGFLDCNFSWNWQMVMKWCKKACSVEEVPNYFSVLSIKFQGHTGQKKSSIFTWILRFRTVASVCIDW